MAQSDVQTGFKSETLDAPQPNNTKYADLWTRNGMNLLASTTSSVFMPKEFGSFQLCDSSKEHTEIAQVSADQEPAFKDVQSASLYELYRISQTPDHATARVEYNAIVGINHDGDIKATSLHKSEVDKPLTSYLANTSAAYEIGGDKVPAALIHSHPRLFEGGKERPWWYFSPTDVQTLRDQSRNYANPKLEGYILGPDGQVLQWKPGGKTIKEEHGEWGVPTMIGKFDKEGNFIPLKKPTEFDHNSQPPESAYDNEHKIPAAKFESWRKEKNVTATA